MHYQSRPAWRYQWPALVGILVLAATAAAAALYGKPVVGVRATQLGLAAAGALALYLLLLVGYRRLAWRYLVDDENIESYHGVLARRVHSIRIQDLRNVNVSQSVVQRLLGVGDVEFSSAAGGDIEVVFFGVDDPLAVKELAQRLQGRLPRAAERD